MSVHRRWEGEKRSRESQLKWKLAVTVQAGPALFAFVAVLNGLGDLEGITDVLDGRVHGDRGDNGPREVKADELAPIVDGLGPRDSLDLATEDLVKDGDAIVEVETVAERVEV